MMKYTTMLLAFGLTLATYTAVAQTAAPASVKAATSGADDSAKKTAPAADDAAKKAEDAAKAEKRARFDLRATEEGDRLNDVKKQMDNLTTQQSDANSKGTLEVQQQRQAVADAYKALVTARQELVNALKTYEQEAVTKADAAVSDAQFECEMAQNLLNTISSQANIANRIGEGAQDARVRDAAKKVLDCVKSNIELQRQARELSKKTAQLNKDQQNLQDDLEIQVLTVQKEQRAKGGN